MSLKTDLLDDLDEFINTDEFAEAVTIGEATINGIFDDGYAGVDLLDASLQSADPQVICKSSDVASVVVDTTVVIKTVTYKVKEIQADGTGITTLILSKN